MTIILDPLNAFPIAILIAIIGCVSITIYRGYLRTADAYLLIAALSSLGNYANLYTVNSIVSHIIFFAIFTWFFIQFLAIATQRRPNPIVKAFL